jgi:hypothetical protein
MATTTPRKTRRKKYDPPFKSLYRLNDSDNKISCNDLGYEIECNGVYENISTTYSEYHPAGSIAAIKALEILGEYYLHTDLEYDHGYLDYIELRDEHPIYNLGWPKDRLPVFNKAPNNFNITHYHYLQNPGAIFDKEFITCGAALLRKLTNTATLQKALITQGIYKINEVGAIVHIPAKEFTPDDRLFNRNELTPLQAGLIEYNKSLRAKLPIDIKLVDKEIFSIYGWPIDKVPNFDDIATQNINAASEQSVAKKSLDDRFDIEDFKSEGLDLILYVIKEHWIPYLKGEKSRPKSLGVADDLRTKKKIASEKIITSIYTLTDPDGTLKKSK